MSEGIESGLAAATIVRREDFTDDLFGLWLRPQVEFRYEPGQYVTIGVKGIERPYSIVSAPYESVIELFIERVRAADGGRLTPLLHALRLGDLVTIRRKAKGRFTLRPSVRHHVMVGTVTGIAPYVSMVRQFLHDHATGTDPGADRRFLVMHGASHQDEFVYDQELRRLSEQHPQAIHYVASVSRPSAVRNAGWNGAIGRVNEILEAQLTRWSPPKEETLIYLCGNPGMIEDVQHRLAPRGWVIVREQYWSNVRPRR